MRKGWAAGCAGEGSLPASAGGCSASRRAAAAPGCSAPLSWPQNPTSCLHPPRISHNQPHTLIPPPHTHTHSCCCTACRQPCSPTRPPSPRLTHTHLRAAAQLAHSNELQDAVLHILQPVVVLIQHLRRVRVCARVCVIFGAGAHVCGSVSACLHVCVRACVCWRAAVAGHGRATGRPAAGNRPLLPLAATRPASLHTVLARARPAERSGTSRSQRPTATPAAPASGTAPSAAHLLGSRHLQLLLGVLAPGNGCQPVQVVAGDVELGGGGLDGLLVGGKCKKKKKRLVARQG